MDKSNIETLDVYQLSENLAEPVWEVVKDWDSFAEGTVGKRLFTSVNSIGANIAEGNGRGNMDDHERHVFIASGSLHESMHWLRLKKILIRTIPPISLLHSTRLMKSSHHSTRKAPPNQFTTNH